MAKSKKRRRAERDAVKAAKKITPGKLFRLVLKSLAFAVVVALVLVLLSLLGLPALNNMWLQFGVMLVIYLLAYPSLMSEFRPKRSS